MAGQFDENSPFMQSHKNTWSGVTRLIKWSSVAVVIVLILMAATLL